MCHRYIPIIVMGFLPNERGSLKFNSKYFFFVYFLTLKNNLERAFAINYFHGYPFLILTCLEGLHVL